LGAVCATAAAAADDALGVARDAGMSRTESETGR
jgi:hypothetical protein